MENNNEVNDVKTPVVSDGKENTMAAIVSYLWWIGWLISYFALYKDNKNEFTTFHLRQSLGIQIISVAIMFLGFGLYYLPFGGYIEWGLRIFTFVLMIMGLISASQGEKKLLPVVGEMFQKWFAGIK